MNHLNAVTVPQPWANAVFARPPYRVEVLVRSETTPYRGRLYIHAGVACDKGAPQWVWDAALVEHSHGYVLGYAELDHVEQGDHAWLWYLHSPVALTMPVACHGRKGRWIIPEHAALLIGS